MQGARGAVGKECVHGREECNAGGRVRNAVVDEMGSGPRALAASNAQAETVWHTNADVVCQGGGSKTECVN